MRAYHIARGAGLAGLTLREQPIPELAATEALVRVRASALSQEALVSIPEHLSYEQAATLPCAAVTAWHALSDGPGVQPGETVLTLGRAGCRCSPFNSRSCSEPASSPPPLVGLLGDGEAPASVEPRACGYPERPCVRWRSAVVRTSQLWLARSPPTISTP
jgi:hypothetical protein